MSGSCRCHLSARGCLGPKGAARAGGMAGSGPEPQPQPGCAWRALALCGAAVFLAAAAAGGALLAWNLAASTSRGSRCPEPASSANTTSTPAPPLDPAFSPGDAQDELQRRLEELTRELEEAQGARQELQGLLRACEGRQVGAMDPLGEDFGISYPESEIPNSLHGPKSL